MLRFRQQGIAEAEIPAQDVRVQTPFPVNGTVP